MVESQELFSTKEQAAEILQELDLSGLNMKFFSLFLNNSRQRVEETGVSLSTDGDKLITGIVEKINQLKDPDTIYEEENETDSIDPVIIILKEVIDDCIKLNIDYKNLQTITDNKWTIVLSQVIESMAMRQNLDHDIALLEDSSLVGTYALVGKMKTPMVNKNAQGLNELDSIKEAISDEDSELNHNLERLRKLSDQIELIDESTFIGIDVEEIEDKIVNLKKLIAEKYLQEILILNPQYSGKLPEISKFSLDEKSDLMSFLKFVSQNDMNLGEALSSIFGENNLADVFEFGVDDLGKDGRFVVSDFKYKDAIKEEFFNLLNSLEQGDFNDLLDEFVEKNILKSNIFPNFKKDVKANVIKNLYIKNKNKINWKNLLENADEG